MISNNYQYPKYVFTITRIIILVTIVPSSYAQQNILQSGQQVNPEWPNIPQNVVTDFNSNVSFPFMEESALIHSFAIVIGNCYIGEKVFVAPTAVCRGDEGTPIHVGAFSNLQDGVVLHGLETTFNGINIDERRFLVMEKDY